MGGATLRVATYGYFGMGNVGNEGSLAAFLAYLREAHPEATVHCFAADAEAVRREHGVPATRLMAYRAAPGSSGLRVRATKAASRLWDVPRTFRLMRDVDVLVVPGTGVLETQLVAQPWGLPYWLFLAALSCRLRGRRVALVSVGAEPAAAPGHPLAAPVDGAAGALPQLPGRRLAQRGAVHGGHPAPGGCFPTWPSPSRSPPHRCDRGTS